MDAQELHTVPDREPMQSAAMDPIPSTAPAQHIPWKQLALFSVLIGLLFAETIYVMVKEWITVEEMGHGFFVPVVAAWVAWQDRARILAQPVRPSWWGLPLLIWAFVQLMLGYLGADFFTARTALFPAVVGVILLCCGAAVLRTLFFPLFILLFMIRLPLFIYSQITFPLQLFASSVAEKLLMLLDIPVLREGNVLELASQKLSVVEACSGIRSLISLTFLAIIYGYFFDRKPWMRWALLVCAVPIAIAANAGRVTLTGIISEWNREFAEGVYHTMEGWVIFIAALVMLVATHQFLDKTYTILTRRQGEAEA